MRSIFRLHQDASGARRGRMAAEVVVALAHALSFATLCSGDPASMDTMHQPRQGAMRAPGMWSIPTMRAYRRRYGMGLVSSVAFVRQMLESCEKRAGEARRTTSASVGLETLYPGQKHARPFSFTGWQLERPS